ncbi:hypothetical protein [Polyangium mundeleinium]|uniref:Uncharacterized protein n=1 Tax=Polyangium mundeleinium TaxID=2995306 RepID=A0ABT5EE33_9BACT|nr:hypothetical protein [Polyangium mundeleinium]MDC0740071.1 hypothetical protein [Polyangium mundeleinium]
MVSVALCRPPAIDAEQATDVAFAAPVVKATAAQREAPIPSLITIAILRSFVMCTPSSSWSCPSRSTRRDDESEQTPLLFITTDMCGPWFE